MKGKQEVKPVNSRPYGNYISTEQDEESGLYVGVVTQSLGEGVPETVLYRGTSMFKSEHDATENVAAWCRDRGYAYQVV